MHRALATSLQRRARWSTRRRRRLLTWRRRQKAVGSAAQDSLSRGSSSSSGRSMREKGRGGVEVILMEAVEEDKMLLLV